MEVTVRPAGPADAGAIAAVQVRSWRSGYRGVLPDALLDGLDEHARAGRWREGLAGAPGGQLAHLAEVDGTAVGFAVTAASRDAAAAAQEGELLAIYVSPDAWRRGIGTALHDAALDGLRREGFATAILWVLRDNPRARPFYEHHGWTTDAAEEPHDFGEHGSFPVVCYRRAL
jgi:GNAT superfamily N-acetyltransferase